MNQDANIATYIENEELKARATELKRLRAAIEAKIDEWEGSAQIVGLADSMTSFAVSSTINQLALELRAILKGE